MSIPAIGAPPFIVQKNNKASGNSNASVISAREIRKLARLLVSATPLGSILRTLVRHIHQPPPAHTEEDIHNLLMLTLAVKRNQERGY
jgi:hypothetical protein